MWPFESKAKRIAKEWKAAVSESNDLFGFRKAQRLRDFVIQHRMETISGSPNLKVAKTVIEAAQTLANAPGGFILGSSVLRATVEHGRSRPIREAALTAYNEVWQRNAASIERYAPPSPQWKWKFPESKPT